MPERPILRLLNPRDLDRRPGAQRAVPRPRGPDRQFQRRTFQASFDRIAAAFDARDPAIELRRDPIGVAPERALVFVTAGDIQNFARVAREAGLEVIAETDLDDLAEIPEGFEPAGGRETLARTLYATIPTIEVFHNLLRLRRAYDRGESAPYGATPWWTLFDLLLELRAWGPEDRFPESARTAIQERLPFDDNEEVIIELEIWPTVSGERRAAWRRETEAKVIEMGGRIIDRSSIASDGFVYEGLLAGLSAGVVRGLIANPFQHGGLATMEGIQFILPQTVAQAPAAERDLGASVGQVEDAFDEQSPVRAVLLDGTPVAAHRALNGGVEIEDLHDLVRLSQVEQRYHATAMASLILRGDLSADKQPLGDARLISVPVLIDNDRTAESPRERLFVDLLHATLVRLVSGNEPLAPQAFVVNLSIGLQHVRFGGRISSIARLIDWWSWKEGLLFVISTGNIADGLTLKGMTALDFEDAAPEVKRQAIRTALRDSVYDRSLLAPAEALNGLTVGALSTDLFQGDPPLATAGVFRLETDGESLPALSNALGLGVLRALKPDLLCCGGAHEFRANPANDDAHIAVLAASQRTGLVVASPRAADRGGTRRERGSSCSTALTTRAILLCAEALMIEGGPYQGQELSREDLALLTRALAVNSARWPDEAHALYREELQRLGSHHHARAKEEVARFFGHGLLVPELMRESPTAGVTAIGLGSVRKDRSKIFDMPLPPSLAGDRVGRAMRVTVAWFSPVDMTRGRYRLASLEAIAAEGDNDEEIDKGWGLGLKGDGPDENMIKRGTIWSRRLVHARLAVPDYDEGATVPIRIQCRDASGGGLDPDLDIRFAVAVTLEVEAEVRYDILPEVRAQIEIRLRGQQ